MNALSIVNKLCVGDKRSNRAALLAYEDFAKDCEQVEVPVKEYRHGGMYAREIVIPKHTMLTGAIYKFNHLDIMISGDVTVTTDSGESKRFTGYNCFEALSGKKRGGFTHEDTHWITVHQMAPEIRDEPQRFLTLDSFEHYDNFRALINQYDYAIFVKSTGMTEEEIRAQVETDDLVDMPKYDHIYLAKSRIQGQGLCSRLAYDNNDLICPSRLGANRTIAGKYANHALDPNARIEMGSNGDIWLIANCYIMPTEEITVNYRDVLATRKFAGDLCQA